MKNYNNIVSNQEVFTGAFLTLFDEFKEFYEDDEFEDIVDQLDMLSLARVVKHKMEQVFVYTAKGGHELALEYQSKPLIKGNACLIYSENDSASCSNIYESYNTELWVTEEFEFVLIKSFIVEIPEENYEYTTTYRTVEKYNPVLCDLPFSVEDLIDDLITLSGGVFDGKTPICEI